MRLRSNFVLLLTLIFLTASLSRASDYSGLEVRVLIGPGLEGRRRTPSRPGEDVTATFQKAIARDLPGAMATVVPNFTLNDVSRSPSEGIQRVLYVIWTHGEGPPRASSSVAAADGDHPPPALAQAVQNASPKGDVRLDVILGFCHAGGCDPRLFPGDVMGVAPSDGVLSSGHADYFVFNLDVGRVKLPATVDAMYETWSRLVTGLKDYSPFWKSTLGQDGERTMVGERTMGDTSNPVYDNHRAMMRQVGYGECRETLKGFRDKPLR